MKMVATAKQRAAQTQLKIARTMSSSLADSIEKPDDKIYKDDGKRQICAFAADRGQCGGVNTQLQRFARPIIRENLNPSTSIIVIGDKGRPGFERDFYKYMDSIYSDQYRNKMIPFQQICKMAKNIFDNHMENLQVIQFFYQKYIDTATNLPVSTKYPSLPILLEHTDLRHKYEVDNNIDTLQNFWEFQIAILMYQMNCDAYTAEVASRVNAMTNSTNNAEDMSNALTLLYNRTRQAKITSELIEIISGASAIE